MTRYSKPQYLTDFNDDPTVWSRRFGDEYWADAYTPLSYCLLRHWIANISLPPSDKIHNKFRYHKGFAYTSSEYWLDVMGEVPTSARLPGVRAYLCRPDQERFDNLPSSAWKNLVFLSRLTPFNQVDPTDGITKNHKAMTEWRFTVERDFQALVETDLTAMRLDELLTAFTVWKERGDYHFVLLKAGQSAWGPIMTQALDGLLRKWGSEEAAARSKVLLGGLPGSLTLETNKDIHRLARQIEDPELKAAVRDPARAGEVVRRLFEGGDDVPAARTFREFIGKYRHRGASREMFEDRWEERPEMVVDLIRGFAGQESLHDPLALEEEKRREREVMTAEILETVGNSGGGFLKTRIFTWVLGMAQTYYLYRENQRFSLDQILFALKKVSLEIGRRYREAGLLEEDRHVFFLFEDELFDLAAKPDYREEIKRDASARRAVYPDQVGHFPPTFLRGHEEYEEDGQERPSADAGTGATVFEGLAVSPGKVRGPARVVTRIEDIGLIEKGEVLVSSNTDPAWTPAFINLAGLVIETGGVLCHGAIVSREYGIPAVTFIPQATRIIKTGQTVEVDGDEGLVRILD
ncbi:MAG: hypothetical protein KKB20_15605 [Proteobacteria bacterium]|nr:hypothetical protein [Pseudomonadota bacterium]